MVEIPVNVIRTFDRTVEPDHLARVIDIVARNRNITKIQITPLDDGKWYVAFHYAIMDLEEQLNNIATVIKGAITKITDPSD